MVEELQLDNLKRGDIPLWEKCNAKKDQEAKEPLDPVRVKAVIGYTVTNPKADPVRVKTSLSTMLSRELGPAQVLQEVSPDKNQVCLPGQCSTLESAPEERASC
ncbi:hypothetical protein MRX96_045834 [Rhipicephalus microplus]